MRFAVRYSLFFIPVLLIAVGARLTALRLVGGLAGRDVLWSVVAGCAAPFLVGLLAYYVIARRVMSAYDRATLGHHVVRAAPLYLIAAGSLLALLLDLSSPDAGFTFHLLLGLGFAALGGILGDLTAGTEAGAQR